MKITNEKIKKYIIKYFGLYTKDYVNTLRNLHAASLHDNNKLTEHVEEQKKEIEKLKEINEKNISEMDEKVKTVESLKKEIDTLENQDEMEIVANLNSELVQRNNDLKETREELKKLRHADSKCEEYKKMYRKESKKNTYLENSIRSSEINNIENITNSKELWELYRGYSIDINLTNMINLPFLKGSKNINYLLGDTLIVEYDDVYNSDGKNSVWLYDIRVCDSKSKQLIYCIGRNEFIVPNDERVGHVLQRDKLEQHILKMFTELRIQLIRNINPMINEPEKLINIPQIYFDHEDCGILTV